MPYTHVSGVDLYDETGGRRAPVILMQGGFPTLASKLNDFSQWTWTWENDFAALFNFTCYDRCGFYRSSSPDPDYDLEN